MGIESISGYKGQGSQISTASVSTAAAKVEASGDAAGTGSATADVVDITSRQETSDGKTSIREDGEASAEQIKQAVDTINKNATNEVAVFGIHEGTNRVMIKIVDKTTKDVIKEFPPEKTLDMIAKVWEMAGIMVDEKR